MSLLIEHVQKAGDSLREGHGEFTLFGLFMPADGESRWDLLIAAPWMKGTLSDYKSVTRAMQKFLSAPEMSEISRITIVDPKTAMGAFDGGAPQRIGEVRNFAFNGLPISDAHIFESAAARFASQPSHRSKKRRLRSQMPNVQQNPKPR